MNSMLLTTLVVVLALAVVLGPWLVAIANRLDRLHVRADAAWAALDAALARRAVVARTLPLSAAGAPDELTDTAARAERADRTERATAENELTGLLAEVDRTTLPPALADELADAEQRVVIARRVHNDAVRDALSQRRRRVVRWLRLAGTAPRPAYLEIAEPADAADGSTPRPSARVVLVDPADRVLLFNGHDPARPGESYWFTAGGGVEPGEELRVAARRELREETGIEVEPDHFVGPVWRRRVMFSFDGRTYDGDEWFFLLRLDTEALVDTSGFTELEIGMVDAHRWWTAAELHTTGETVYPVQLATLLPELLAAGWDGVTRPVR